MSEPFAPLPEMFAAHSVPLTCSCVQVSLRAGPAWDESLQGQASWTAVWGDGSGDVLDAANGEALAKEVRETGQR